MILELTGLQIERLTNVQSPVPNNIFVFSVYILPPPELSSITKSDLSVSQCL